MMIATSPPMMTHLLGRLTDDLEQLKQIYCRMPGCGDKANLLIVLNDISNIITIAQNWELLTDDPANEVVG